MEINNKKKIPNSLQPIKHQSLFNAEIKDAPLAEEVIV